MLKLCLVLLLSASVLSESVRETETWMPMKTAQTAAMLSHRDTPESSGSDFGFADDEDERNRGEGDGDDDDYIDTLYDDEDEYEDEDFSGSGDGDTTVPPRGEPDRSAQPGLNNNRIPEAELPVRPTANEADIVRNSNEIPLLRGGANTGEEHPSNVLMSHAADDNIFNRTEVLAALIAGGVVVLMLAVLPILLLIYCMKKKDEGSYDLGRKPIYKKAPTTEIYA